MRDRVLEEFEYYFGFRKCVRDGGYFEFYWNSRSSVGYLWPVLYADYEESQRVLLTYSNLTDIKIGDLIVDANDGIWKYTGGGMVINLKNDFCPQTFSLENQKDSRHLTIAFDPQGKIIGKSKQHEPAMRQPEFNDRNAFIIKKK